MKTATNRFGIECAFCFCNSAIFCCQWQEGKRHTDEFLGAIAHRCVGLRAGFPQGCTNKAACWLNTHGCYCMEETQCVVSSWILASHLCCVLSNCCRFFSRRVFLISAPSAHVSCFHLSEKLPSLRYSKSVLSIPGVCEAYFLFLSLLLVVCGWLEICRLAASIHTHTCCSAVLCWAVKSQWWPHYDPFECTHRRIFYFVVLKAPSCDNWQCVVMCKKRCQDGGKSGIENWIKSNVQILNQVSLRRCMEEMNA